MEWQLSEEELEFYSSLSESTVYLLGDPDLIALWEDAHKRKIMNYKADIDSKINHMKPTDLGVIRSNKEYDTALKQAGKEGRATKYQVRTNLRDNEKFRKEMKKKYHEGRAQFVQNRIKDGTAKNKKEANHLLRKHFEKENSVKDFDQDHYAAYNHKSNTLYMTDKKGYDERNKSRINIFTGEKKGTEGKSSYQHELQHWRDHMYLRGKYGKQGANNIHKKMDKVDYWKNPTEVNAHQHGNDVLKGNTADRSNEYKQRLDNFVKTGKAKESVPMSQRK